ncbi:MAG: zinc ABC transporter substrate-binding protein [Phycisphaerae bacterium]|nr:zinc ABC transporter substrate-binding protein [Phycisphaerae bacterium]
MMRRTGMGAAAIATIGAAWVGTLCSRASTPAAARVERYKITATVGMVADIVRQVAGDRAEVTNIIGEGVDPHLYKPTRGDVAALMSADAIFYNGLMLEGKMADTLVKVATSGKKVYAVTELLDEKDLLEPESFAGHFDPHVWMDASAWSKAVEAVARSLSEFDPPNAATYRANADRYRKELEALHAYVRKVIASIPREQRVLITAHDAFNYFGRAYDLEVLGIQGISTESEAGLADINRLVDLMVARKVRAVFVETSVADKNVRALVEGAKARGHEVRIGGSLFSDAMGKPGTYEGTYVGMIDHNATTIARALGGEAPQRGMSGKLSEALGSDER